MAYKGRKRKAPVRKRGGSPLFLWVVIICAAVAAVAWWMGGPSPDKPEGRPSPSQSVSAPARPAAQEQEQPTERKGKDVVPEKEKRAAKTEPVHQEEKKAPSPVRKAGHGLLAICVDDGGYDLGPQRVYEKLGIPLTLAVIPNQTYTESAAAEWAASGLEVIVHQPMESIAGQTMEKTTILTSMSDAQIRTVLSRSLAQVPQAVGINNHQGSKATADPRVMKAVMGELSHRGLFFFDSRTNRNSVGTSTAHSYGVRAVNNELFIDNDPDEDAIRARLRQAADIALRDGRAVVIGHCRPHTAAAFASMVPELQAMGIEFVFLSSLVR